MSEREKQSQYQIQTTMRKLKSLVKLKSVSSDSEDKPHNPIILQKIPMSYLVSGNICLSGAVLYSKKNFKDLSTIITAEMTHALPFDRIIAHGIREDLYQEMKTKSYTASTPRGKSNLIEVSVNIRKFINLPVFPANYSRAIVSHARQDLMVLNSTEDRVHITYNVSLSIGDNNADVYDALLRNNYIKKQVSTIKVDPNLSTMLDYTAKDSHFMLELALNNANMKAELLGDKKRQLSLTL